MFLLYRQECFTRKYTGRKIHSQTHQGLNLRKSSEKKSEMFGNVHVIFGQVL